MIGLLLENKTAAEAAKKIQQLKFDLESSGFSFGEIAPLLLTDNGDEFSSVFAFENDTSGNTESKLFFCEPHSPHEKAEIKKKHTLFRDIVKSGTSFDFCQIKCTFFATVAFTLRIYENFFKIFKYLN